MTDFVKLNLDRQMHLAHIHEAGHVIAARYCQMEVVSCDIYTHGNQCGLTRIVPMSAAYSISTGLPLNKAEAFTGFTRHNFELLAGPAAQAIYCYENDEKTLNAFAPVQPDIWGILLEFSKEDCFCDFDEESLTHGMGFFLNETGASGDWKTILNHFRTLPYHYFEETDTHDKRINYLRALWNGVLELLRKQWDDVIKIAEGLKFHKKLSGAEIEKLLASP